MTNKKQAPDILRDGAKIVGGPDKMKVIEAPYDQVIRDQKSVPGHDPATHAHLSGPGKKRFPLKSKSGW
jgi:hypothetical protein